MLKFPSHNLLEVPRRRVQCFSASSSVSCGSLSFFHHKLVKRVTLLLIGGVSSPSLALSISWLCSRLRWFGMTILQRRNADKTTELPGVAASQLSRNKASLTDWDEEIRKKRASPESDRQVCTDYIFKLPVTFHRMCQPLSSCGVSFCI